MQFEALGRRFDLTLEPNTALLSPAARGLIDGRIEVLRGRIDGNRDSWARIVLTDGVPSGIIYDGSELLAIEPPGDSAVESAAGPVVFRLADMMIEIEQARSAVYWAACANDEGSDDPQLALQHRGGPQLAAHDEVDGLADEVGVLHVHATSGREPVHPLLEPAEVEQHVAAQGRDALRELADGLITEETVREPEPTTESIDEELAAALAGELKALDMSVDEGLKMIISLGVVVPRWRSPEAARLAAGEGAA